MNLEITFLFNVKYIQCILRLEYQKKGPLVPNKFIPNDITTSNISNKSETFY